MSDSLKPFLIHVDLNDIELGSESEEDEISTVGDADSSCSIPFDGDGGLRMDDNFESDSEGEAKLGYFGESDKAEEKFSSRGVGFHNMKFSTNVENRDFSYFDKALRAHWTGNEHWKLGTRIRSKCYKPNYTFV